MDKNELNEAVVNEDVQEKLETRKLKFYGILRERISSFMLTHAGENSSKLTNYLLALPDFFILLCRLAVDKRVTSSQKIFVGGIIAYVMMPIDIIPDFIPIIGYVDDLVLVVYGLDLILNELDKQILIDNWSGGEDVLVLLQKITDAAENFLDKNILKKIKNWFSNMHR